MDGDTNEKILFDEADFSFMITLADNNLTLAEFYDNNFQRFVYWEFTLI